MTYSVSYSKGIDKILKKWKKSNPVLFKKYSKILEELILHPREGLGHPEALVKGLMSTKIFQPYRSKFLTRHKYPSSVSVHFG